MYKTNEELKNSKILKVLKLCTQSVLLNASFYFNSAVRMRTKDYHGSFYF